MSAADTAQQTEEQVVFAPEGMAWVDDDEYTGRWESTDQVPYTDQQHVRYPYYEGGAAGSYILRVPTDETASKGDVMYLATQVVRLQREVDVLVSRLHAAAALLDRDSIIRAAYRIGVDGEQS